MASNILHSPQRTLKASGTSYLNDASASHSKEDQSLKSLDVNAPSQNRNHSDARSSTLASRRRSVARDQKVPSGPRPLDTSSKRSTTGLQSVPGPPSSRTLLPSTTSEPFLGLSARRIANVTDSPRDGSASDSSASAPQTPRLSSPHSARQASLAPEPRLEDFPKPNSSKPAAIPRNVVPVSRRSASIGRRLSLTRSSVDGRPNLRPRPSASPVRSGNPALQAAQRSSASIPAAAAAPNLGPSTRRQSQLPPSSPSKATVKQPRKSIGPGYTISSAKERTVFDPASRTFVPDTRHMDGSRKHIVEPFKPRQSSIPASASTLTGSMSTHRDIKSQSLHQSSPKANPSISPANVLSTMQSASGQDDTTNGSLLANPLSLPPPSASGRRQSNAATYVGGLGARTVSPTDVRRSRRLSTAAPQPASTQAQSPSPELLLVDRPPPTPPAAIYNKPGTPSSSRATPDAGLPMNALRSAASSRSSYTSVRPMSSSSQHRINNNVSHGRSGSSKSRNHQSSGGGEDELVPPVPAIPKAFESPTDVTDKPFFMHDLIASASGSSQQPAEDKEDEPFMTPEEQKPDPLSPSSVVDTRFGRRLTFAGRLETQRDGLTRPRQSQEHAHLPPLNLLPLSTPAVSKIASYSQNSKDSTGDGLARTPPPIHPAHRTPTTPMTASKALFSTYDIHKSLDSTTALPTFRSSTAVADQRPDMSIFNPLSSESPNLFMSGSSAAGRHGPSPFGSFSLPRLNGELQNLPTRQAKEEMQDASQASRRASNFLHRRPSTKTNKDSSTATNGTGEVDSVTAPPSSLRRKLSFGWRRSSSKASHTSQYPDDDPSSTSEMPPPKLPASAVLSAQAKSPKLSSKAALSKPTESSSSFKGLQSRNASATELPRPSTKSGTSDKNVPSTRSSSSLFSMPRMLAARNSQGNLKNGRSDPAVDRDDLAADEEMKKLAYRRKEFEVAAKDLDELRKRASPKERVSPAQATNVASLNLFERGEIIDYRDVYFCGTKNAPKIVGDLAAESTNFGFDDERGDYKIVLGDHLAYRYEVLDVLGKGSFGQVVRCIDHKKGHLVAIKIIRNKKRFHQQALVEVNILQKLREWDPKNVHSMINFTQSFYFRGHLCISTELLGVNLYEFIKAHDFSGFSLKLIRRFTKQMLASLILLQSRSVIHCDLKPENILLAHPLQSEIKVIDFGSSCFENEKVYTYIQSRFYRSPEVILGMSYGMPIDMWSLGCILAELFTGYPIFPGENEQEQLSCIMEVFGPPEKHLIERASRKKLFFDSLGKPRITVSSKGKRRRPSSKTLSQALKCDDEAFLDFIGQCLRWDPERRMKPDEALRHDFVTGTKKGSRLRGQHGTASPAKRLTSSTPLKAKANGEANGKGVTTAASGTRGGPSDSPVKGGFGSRRKSTMYEQQDSSKSSVGLSNTTASSLPRMSQGQRSISGKPDLASAAAIASLNSGSKARNA